MTLEHALEVKHMTMYAKQKVSLYVDCRPYLYHAVPAGLNTVSKKIKIDSP